jgi:tRNA 2-thiouridine synthesizing protein A
VSDYQLDARRILCPLPVIRTQDKIQHLKPGDQLEVTCTDPGAVNDIPTWCRINGHTVKDIQQHEYEIVIRIEVGTAE